jgi:hypothetical protein
VGSHGALPCFDLPKVAFIHGSVGSFSFLFDKVDVIVATQGKRGKAPFDWDLSKTRVAHSRVGGVTNATDNCYLWTRHHRGSSAAEIPVPTALPRDVYSVVSDTVCGTVCGKPVAARMPTPQVLETRLGVYYHGGGLLSLDHMNGQFEVRSVFTPTKWCRRWLQVTELASALDIPHQFVIQCSAVELKLLCIHPRCGLEHCAKVLMAYAGVVGRGGKYVFVGTATTTQGSSGETRETTPRQERFGGREKGEETKGRKRGEETKGLLIPGSDQAKASGKSDQSGKSDPDQGGGSDPYPGQSGKSDPDQPGKVSGPAGEADPYPGQTGKPDQSGKSDPVQGGRSDPYPGQSGKSDPDQPGKFSGPSRETDPYPGQTGKSDHAQPGKFPAPSGKSNHYPGQPGKSDPSGPTGETNLYPGQSGKSDPAQPGKSLGQSRKSDPYSEQQGESNPEQPGKSDQSGKPEKSNQSNGLGIFANGPTDNETGQKKNVEEREDR